jgi:hypothetical protein
VAEALLTDAQFGVLIATLSAAGAATLGFFRWAVKTGAEVAKVGLEVIKENAKNSRELAVEVAGLKEVVRGAADNAQAVRDKVHEDSGVHERVGLLDDDERTPVQKPRRNTDPEGVGVYSHTRKKL